MLAKDFIEKFGWSLACRDIAALESGFIKSVDFLEHYGFEIPSDLKQYTDAWELVQENGGLKEALDFLRFAPVMHPDGWKLQGAIQLVESIEVKNV